jgi:hypothetical protein
LLDYHCKFGKTCPVTAVLLRQVHCVQALTDQPIPRVRPITGGVPLDVAPRIGNSTEAVRECGYRFRQVTVIFEQG